MNPQPEILSVTSLRMMASVIFFTVFAPGCQGQDGQPPRAPTSPRAAPIEYHAIDLTDDRVDAMRQTLAAVGRTLRRNDTKTLASYFDFYRMAHECNERAGKKIVSDRQMPAYVQELERGIVNGFKNATRFLSFGEFRILRCYVHEDQQSAVLVVRQVSEELGILGKFRWWLVEGRDGWRIFDFEDLHMPIRFTDGMLATHEAHAKGGLPRLAKIQALSAQLTKARVAIADGDPHQAETLIAERDLTDVPPIMQAVVWLVRAAAACDREAYAEAMSFVVQAERLRKDMPAVDMIRARALNGTGKHQDALQFGQAYIKMMGPDPDGFFLLGESKRGMGQLAEAAVFYRKSLQEDVNYVDALAQLVRIEPVGPEKIIEHLTAMKDTDENFNTICYFLEEEQDYDSLNRVVEAYRSVAPLNVDVAYYGATVLQQRGRHAEAAEMVLPAVSRAPDDEKEAFEYLYLDAMLQAKRPIDGYGRVDDKIAAFETLASSLAYSKVDSEEARLFEELVAVHQQDHADDPNIVYYRAASLIHRDNPLDAAELLLPTVKVLVQENHEELEYYVDQYLDAMLQAGKPLEAYNEAPNPTYAFEWLAQEMIYSEQADELEALATLHMQKQPDDPRGKYYFAEAALLREDWQQVIDRFIALRKDVDDTEVLEEMDVSVTLALFELGQFQRAFDLIDRDKDVFIQLAQLADSNEEPDELERIIAIFKSVAAGMADEPAIAYFSARLHARRGAHDAAAGLLLAHRDAIITDDEYAWRLTPTLVHSLIAIGRYDEAIEEARLTENGIPSTLLASAHAAAGDVEATRQSLAGFLDKQPWYEPNWLYNVEILGPALRSKQFAQLRKELDARGPRMDGAPPSP